MVVPTPRHPNIFKQEVFAWMSIGQMLFIVQLCFFSEPTFSYFWNPKCKNLQQKILWIFQKLLHRPAGYDFNLQFGTTSCWAEARFLGGWFGWLSFVFFGKIWESFFPCKTNISKEKHAFEYVMYLRSGWGFYIKSLNRER